MTKSPQAQIFNPTLFSWFNDSSRRSHCEGRLSPLRASVFPSFQSWLLPSWNDSSAVLQAEQTVSDGFHLLRRLLSPTPLILDGFLHQLQSPPLLLRPHLNWQRFVKCFLPGCSIWCWFPGKENPQLLWQTSSHLIGCADKPLWAMLYTIMENLPIVIVCVLDDDVNFTTKLCVYEVEC